MKKKKKQEGISTFMKRRNAETGKVSIPETKVSPPNSGGSHKTLARQMMIGVVKPKTKKFLEKKAKKKKMKQLYEANA